MVKIIASQCIAVILLCSLQLVHSTHGSGFDVGLLLGNRSCNNFGAEDFQRVECCSDLSEAFESSWQLGNVYLTQFLHTLEAWHCQKELSEQCATTPYKLNEFTELVYMSFCDHPQLEERCLDKVKALFSESEEELGWNATLSKVDLTSLSSDQLLESCVQVAVYELDNNEGNFVEVIFIDLEICPIVWSGHYINGHSNQNVFLWSRFPLGCKFGSIFVGLLFLMLTIFCLFLNITVLYTICTTTALRHSQFMYMASIAVCDIIMASLLYPSIIHNTRSQSNRFVHFEKPSTNSSIYIPEHNEPFGEDYKVVFGFIEMICLLAPLYTLLMAAGDRLFAIWYPLKYNDIASVGNAIRWSVFAWVISFFIALIPFVGTELTYDIDLRVIITMHGKRANLVYILAFSIPVVIMWSLASATYFKVRSSLKMANHMRSRSKSTKKSRQETRLAKTLIQTVVAYTLTLFPMSAFLTIAMIFPDKFDPNKRRQINHPGAPAIYALEWISFIFLVTNTIWNFVILITQNRRFRRSLIVVLQRLASSLGCEWLHDKINELKSSSDAGVTPATPASPTHVRTFDWKKETIV